MKTDAKIRMYVKCAAPFTCLLLASLLNGCGASRPVLYPNPHFKEVGETKAGQEIDECFRMADEAKASGNKSAEIAKNSAMAGAVGAATGAVIGAITGDVGRSIAVGGAGAATATMGMGVMRSGEPDPIFKQFVEQCLREKGFQPIGWR